MALVKDIFLDAIELPADQRQSFVQQLSDGDSKVAQEVSSLLDSYPEEHCLKSSLDEIIIKFADVVNKSMVNSPKAKIPF